MIKVIDDKTGNIKRCIRYKDGKNVYGMCQSTFERRAKEAGAVYKVGKAALVDVDIFDKYLETFRLPAIN